MKLGKRFLIVMIFFAATITYIGTTNVSASAGCQTDDVCYDYDEATDGNSGGDFLSATYLTDTSQYDHLEVTGNVYEDYPNKTFRDVYIIELDKGVNAQGDVTTLAQTLNFTLEFDDKNTNVNNEYLDFYLINYNGNVVTDNFDTGSINKSDILLDWRGLTSYNSIKTGSIDLVTGIYFLVFEGSGYDFDDFNIDYKLNIDVTDGDPIEAIEKMVYEWKQMGYDGITWNSNVNLGGFTSPLHMETSMPSELLANSVVLDGNDVFYSSVDYIWDFSYFEEYVNSLEEVIRMMEEVHQMIEDSNATTEWLINITLYAATTGIKMAIGISNPILKVATSYMISLGSKKLGKLLCDWLLYDLSNLEQHIDYLNQLKNYLQGSSILDAGTGYDLTCIESGADPETCKITTEIPIAIRYMNLVRNNDEVTNYIFAYEGPTCLTWDGSTCIEQNEIVEYAGYFNQFDYIYLEVDKSLPISEIIDDSTVESIVNDGCQNNNSCQSMNQTTLTNSIPGTFELFEVINNKTFETAANVDYDIIIDSDKVIIDQNEKAFNISNAVTQDHIISGTTSGYNYAQYYKFELTANSMLKLDLDQTSMNVYDSVTDSYIEYDLNAFNVAIYDADHNELSPDKVGLQIGDPLNPDMDAQYDLLPGEYYIEFTMSSPLNPTPEFEETMHINLVGKIQPRDRHFSDTHEDNNTFSTASELDTQGIFDYNFLEDKEMMMYTPVFFTSSIDNSHIVLDSDFYDVDYYKFSVIDDVTKTTLSFDFEFENGQNGVDEAFQVKLYNQYKQLIQTYTSTSTDNTHQLQKIDFSRFLSQGDYYLKVETTYTPWNLNTKHSYDVGLWMYDNFAPEISLNGPSTQYVEVDSSYQEYGVTVEDDHDSNLTVNTSGSVDTSYLHTITRTYSVTDSGGYTSSVSRQIVVRDTTDPVIYLKSSYTDEFAVGSTYPDLLEPVLSAYDNYDTYVNRGEVNISTNLDMNTPGYYTVNYSVTDFSGNTGNKSITVGVYETQTKYQHQEYVKTDYEWDFVLSGDVGYFTSSHSTKTIYSGDYKSVYGATSTEYYRTKTKYELYDKICFSIYKRETNWLGIHKDEYKKQVCYYRDETPSYSDDADDFDYTTYYTSSSGTGSKYIGNSWSVSGLDGATRTVYMNDRNGVSDGKYFVKYTTISDDIGKKYITAYSGSWGSSITDYKSGDYWYDYYYSTYQKGTYTDAYGVSRTSSYRYKAYETLYIKDWNYEWRDTHVEDYMWSATTPSASSGYRWVSLGVIRKYFGD